MHELPSRVERANPLIESACGSDAVSLLELLKRRSLQALAKKRLPQWAGMRKLLAHFVFEGLK
jgi:hypothetical protein